MYKFITQVKTITGPVSYAQAEGLFKSVSEVREKAGDDLGKLSAVLSGDAKSGEPEKPTKKRKQFGEVIIIIVIISSRTQILQSRSSVPLLDVFDLDKVCGRVFNFILGALESKTFSLDH